MSALDDVRDAIAVELRTCEARVHALIDSATTLSEREVVAIGTHIAEINREAVTNLDALTGLSSEFDTSAVQGRSSLETAVRGQEGILQAFASDLNEGLAHQREATAGIVEVARKIQGFVAGIEVVALDLRMLTLNAKLEAARWGSKGAAFVTVAIGMRDLTTEVQRVNEHVGSLATRLSSLATQVVDNEKVMHGLGLRLTEDVAARMNELRRAYDQTRTSTAKAVSAGTEGAHRMVAISTNTLTNLQFQDRMAQTLREAEAVVACARAVTDELLAYLGADSEGDVGAAIQRVRARSGNAVVRISAESELQSSDMGMQSGVVELF
jgi:methyl-accepting chemotaxis protein